MDISLANLIELVKKVNRNKVPNPMPAEEISRLRVRKYRDPQNTETTELPESLKALLAYDRDLLSNYNMPVIETLQRSIDNEGVIHSYSPDEEAYYGAGMDSSGIDIEDLMPFWSNDPRLPALIRIDHVGDQAIFIYITERDANGEYPIARMERNEFWLAESSLVEYLYNIISGAKDIGFTEEDLHLPQWKAQQKMNEQRDAALLDLEDYHEAFWAKLDALVD
ncbi:DUF5066 family protein [Salmonella enterica subsp. enterica serovar Corvallis]|nr:DUF5066 family protein [Salmonella enterica]EBG9624564.1 DUF5066 family protein [Salmonella enterica subsp. enterica serovar Stanley]EBI8797813.1 DUF5066 family protein [Salmonella enterica]EBY5232034.1 DUF5066 family protein [Salmonella enterica subsp. enterica serovar Stanley]EBY7646647.1 DUF5066 family protein [Salmonella enterica subsp. enterica serovar Stanley]